jgi:hypothetical protein
VALSKRLDGSGNAAKLDAKQVRIVSEHNGSIRSCISELEWGNWQCENSYLVAKNAATG